MIIKKITTFIHPYILSLCSISMLLAMSTVHAASFNDDIYYGKVNEDRRTTNAKLTALPQQVARCNTLTKEEKEILKNLLEANFSSATTPPYKAAALLSAVKDYTTESEYHDFTCIDDYTSAFDKRKETLISCLSDAKAFFAEKVKKEAEKLKKAVEETKYDKNKVVNSLLQLICLQGSNDATLTTFINVHLNSYDLHIAQVNKLIEKFPLQEKPTALSNQPQAIEKKEKAPQQTSVQPTQEKATIETEKKIIQTFLAQLKQSRYLQMKIAYVMALLPQYTEREEELAKAIQTLQYALKANLEPLHQHITTAAQASPISIDKIINDFLCSLVDTHAEAPKAKESKNIQALYIAQFRFNLLETIKQDLKKNPQLEKWLNKLNRSGEAIVIEEMITPAIAETLMKLHTFMQNSSITLDEKKKVNTEVLQKLKEVILLTCTDQFNTIKQKLTAIPTDKLIQQLEQQVALITITSLQQTCTHQYNKVKKRVISIAHKANKHQAMQHTAQNISKACTQHAKHLKTLYSFFISKEDKQAEIKHLLQQINKQIQNTYTYQASKIKAQVAPSPNNETLQQPVQKISSTTTPIGTSIKTKTTHFRNPTQQTDFTAWFNKLKHNIQTQEANPLPLLGLLLIILLHYSQQLQSIISTT